MRKRIAIIAIALVGTIAGVAEATTSGGVQRGEVVARVYGCEYEDSCMIDYTRNGVWVIREDPSGSR